MKSHLNVVSFTFSLLFTHFVFPLLLCLSLSVFRLHIYSLFFFLDQSGGQLHNRYSSRNIENIKQYYHSQCCMHVCVSARHVCINSVCTSSCPMRINASCVWLYAPACLRARELQLYVHVAYTCMCVCVCVPPLSALWTAGQLTPQRGWISISNHWHNSACLLTATSLPWGRLYKRHGYQPWDQMKKDESGAERHTKLFRISQRALINNCSAPIQHLWNFFFSTTALSLITIWGLIKAALINECTEIMDQMTREFQPDSPLPQLYQAL